MEESTQQERVTYKDGDLVWFLKSMRMCWYRGPCTERGYEGLHEVERMDTGKRLLASLDGLAPVNPNEEMA